MVANKRRWGREMALQMLYQLELGESEARDVRARFNPVEYLAAMEEGSPPDAERVQQAFAFAGELFDGTLGRLEEVDAMIRSQAQNWRLERMPAVDRNILRLAIYELLAEPDVPQLVVLDEAIELAKRYGSDQSGAFVNGLLDGLLKRAELPGSKS